MIRNLIALSLILVPVSSFLFGGCCAPQLPTPCCQSTSWAYAPPRIIGYERIPLYAKVPMPVPPPQYMNPVAQTPYYPSPPVPPPPPPPSPPLTPYKTSPYDYVSYNTNNIGQMPMNHQMMTKGPMSTSPSIPQVIPLSQADSYGEGDTIIIETDDGRVVKRRHITKNVQPPPTGYAQPVPQQPPQVGYSEQPQQQIGGQVENGVEVTLDNVSNGGYSPNGMSVGQPQQMIPSSNYSPSQSISPPSSAFEMAGSAPSARRLRKFKNFF